MPSEMIIILGVLVVGSWLLMGEKKPFWERLAIIFAIAFVYAALRLLGGASLDDLLTPFAEQPKIEQTSNEYWTFND